MRTRSLSNFPVVSSNPSTSNPKRRNRRRSKQPFTLEESPVDTMVDQRTMAELLRAPTEGYAEANVVPPILAEQFKLKHSLINMMTKNQFFGLERIILMIASVGVARRWLEKEPPRSIHTWEDLVQNSSMNSFPPQEQQIFIMKYLIFKNGLMNRFMRHEIDTKISYVLALTMKCPGAGRYFADAFDQNTQAWDKYKDLLCACPHHGFTELHQLDTFYNALNPADQDSLNAAVEIAKLTNAVNLQTIVVTTAMTAILKQFQATRPSSSVKAVEEICVTYGGAHLYYQCLTVGGNTFLELRDNIQGYVSAAAVNYNQGNSVYRPLGSRSLPSNTVANPKGELKAITTRSGLVLNGPSVPTPPPFINQEKDERVEETLMDPNLSEYTIKVPPPPLPINITLADALILMPKYQKILKALLSNKEKLQELAKTPLNENCSSVILKKLLEKLGDPRKFLIPCGFSLPELISTRMTLELANQAICTPAGIARDVFIPVGKFTFPADFVIVDYKSDPRVPLILGRPFLQTARDLIDVHGEEMILRNGDERLTLNMRHDTSNFYNQPQKESINLINIFNDSSKDFIEDLSSTNQPSGNPTFLSHPELTLPKVQNDIFDLEGGTVLPEKLLDLDSTKDFHLPLHVNPLSGSTTYSSSPNPLLKELTDELALITFPPKYNDDLYNLANPANIFVDSMPEMFSDEHALDYSSPLIFDEYDLFEVESDVENVYDDPFDSKGGKIKESKLLIDELDLPCDFLPPSEYDSFIYEDFSRVDVKPSTNNEDKVFNLGILSQENPFEIITRVVQDKKLAISNASLVLEDFNPPLYELPFFKEVPKSKMLLLFSSENEENVFEPGIHTSEKVHSSFIPELSHQGYKVFKINQIFKSLMTNFLFSCRKDTHILAFPCLHFYPLDQFKYGGIGSSIPKNLKTHAEGFCPPVFSSSASLGNHVSKSNGANVYLMAYLINNLRFM
nr:hypothetical protein [Tanacetum cinerariifolium]